MSQYTPGPWLIKNHQIYEGARACIAELFAPDEGCVEGNANLIAAAPDLLKALETLFERPVDYLHSEDWNMIAEAIAKAKGIK